MGHGALDFETPGGPFRFGGVRVGRPCRLASRDKGVSGVADRACRALRPAGRGPGAALALLATAGPTRTRDASRGLGVAELLRFSRYKQPRPNLALRSFVHPRE